MNHQPLAWITFCTLLIFVGCSGSTDGGGGVTNELAQSYPTDLALTSPFATGSAVEGLTKLSPRAQTSGDSGDIPSFKAKQDAIAARIDAKDQTLCGFTVSLFRNPISVECYGPTIDYSNHPNATFDDPTSGQLPSGDVGIWDEYETLPGGGSEACVAAKVNSLIDAVQRQVDTAINLFTSMLCVANVNGTATLPAIGESKDFKTAIQEAMDATLTPVTLTTASLGREDDSAEGDPVYVSEIVSTLTGNSKTAEIHLNLKHIPTNSDNSTYKGQIWYTLTGDLGTGPGCGNGSPKLFAGSILYKKASATSLTYRMQRATYCSDTASPFDADNLIDPANKYDNGANPEGWSGDFNDGTFEIDPSDGSGVFSYAWQAGDLDSNTRVFLAELTPQTDGTLAGCGYFGFGPDVESSDVGVIDGMICNWAGPGANHLVNDTVQRQCVTFDSATGHYVSDADTLAITYAPTNSCDSAGDPFVFDGIIDAVSSNLILATEMQADITPPTKPEPL